MSKVDASNVTTPKGVIDAGFPYPKHPKFLADVDNDGLREFGRCVGGGHEGIFLAFAKPLRDGTFPKKLQMGYRSVRGIDPGVTELPRFLDRFEGSERLSYFRYVGNYPKFRLAVNIARETSFDLGDPHGINHVDDPNPAINENWWRKYGRERKLPLPQRFLENPFCTIELSVEVGVNFVEVHAFNHHPSRTIVFDGALMALEHRHQFADIAARPRASVLVKSLNFYSDRNKAVLERAKFDGESNYSTDCFSA